MRIGIYTQVLEALFATVRYINWHWHLHLHFEWYHFQLPSDFKVTPFFDAEYLRNGTRYRHSYNEILIGTYALLKGVISKSDLAKYSMTRRIAWSWDSCWRHWFTSAWTAEHLAIWPTTSVLLAAVVLAHGQPPVWCWTSLARRRHWKIEHLPSPDRVTGTAFLLPSVIRHCRC